MISKEHDAILKERARRLAEALQSEDRGRHRVHLILRVGGEEYAVPAEVVVRVLPLDATGWAVAPGSPPFVAGLVNFGGTVFPLIDFAPLVSLPAQKPGPSSHVVLVGSPSWRGGNAALLVSSRPRVEAIDLDHLEPAVVGMGGGSGAGFELGIAHGTITVLDLETLLDRTLAPRDDEGATGTDAPGVRGG